MFAPLVLPGREIASGLTPIDPRQQRTPPKFVASRLVLAGTACFTRHFSVGVIGHAAQLRAAETAWRRSTLTSFRRCQCPGIMTGVQWSSAWPIRPRPVQVAEAWEGLPPAADEGLWGVAVTGGGGSRELVEGGGGHPQVRAGDDRVVVDVPCSKDPVGAASAVFRRDRAKKWLLSTSRLASGASLNNNQRQGTWWDGIHRRGCGVT